MYRIRQTLITSANLFLVYLMFKLVFGQLTWGLALGSILLSAFWLGMTAISLRSLFTTYYDWLSRLRVRLPLVSGVILSSVAILANDSTPLRLLAGVELAAWAGLYFWWRHNAENFVKTGHGLLPAKTWLNPPAAVIRSGDLILTSGRMAERMDQAVGHGEVAVLGEDGRLMLLSSYMNKGTVINEAEKLLRIMVKKGEQYVVLRLRTPLTDKQIKGGWAIAQGMLGENIAWREDYDRRRKAFIGRLFLPAAAKSWLTAKTDFMATGYDWLGLFIGVKARNRWTCIGACAEWYKRLRVPMRHYGTGLLGIGTGILDPIQPQRFMTDPSLELLVDAHREEYERSQAAS